MLVLSRKSNESLFIDGDIKVVILEIRGNSVVIGIEAPRDVSVVRSEICRRPARHNSPTQTVETADETPASDGNVAIFDAIDSRSLEVLHQFCERRNSWRTAQVESAERATDEVALCAVS